MMQLLILALIQGVTEFMPVSSSTHLAVAASYLKFKSAYDWVLWLHVSTAAALIVYFYRDILLVLKGIFKRDDNPETHWAPLIAISTGVTAASVLILEKIFPFLDESWPVSFILLVIMGIILLVSGRFAPGDALIRWKHAVFFGIAQALAVLPGLSRSGMTIVCLLWAGVALTQAFKYSFIASVPIIFLGLTKELYETGVQAFPPRGEAVLSLSLAFAVGLISLQLMNIVLKKRKFHWFGFYCMAAGFTGLFIR